jgi:hypothetical protein
LGGARGLSDSSRTSTRWNRSPRSSFVLLIRDGAFLRALWIRSQLKKTRAPCLANGDSLKMHPAAEPAVLSHANESQRLRRGMRRSPSELFRQRQGEMKRARAPTGAFCCAGGRAVPPSNLLLSLGGGAACSLSLTHEHRAPTDHAYQGDDHLRPADGGFM